MNVLTNHAFIFVIPAFNYALVSTTIAEYIQLLYDYDRDGPVCRAFLYFDLPGAGSKRPVAAQVRLSRLGGRVQAKHSKQHRLCNIGVLASLHLRRQL